MTRDDPDNKKHRKDHGEDDQSLQPSSADESVCGFLVNVELAVASRDEHTSCDHAVEDPSLAATDFLGRPGGCRAGCTGNTEVPHESVLFQNYCGGTHLDQRTVRE